MPFLAYFIMIILNSFNPYLYFILHNNDDNDGIIDEDDLDADDDGFNDAMPVLAAAAATSSDENSTINTEFSVTNVEQEHVVLNFNLNSDSVDAAIHEISFSSVGTLDESADITIAKLYFDANKNGLAEANELVAENTFAEDDGEITFILSAPQQLAIGENQLLMTYTF